MERKGTKICNKNHLNYGSVGATKAGRGEVKLAPGRRQEVSLTTKFVTKFLTRYWLKLKITIANMYCELRAISKPVTPDESSQPP